MGWIGYVPRRSVNLPPGSLGALIGAISGNQVLEGPSVERFYREFGRWLGTPHVFGAASGRVAFHLALESLGLQEGSEIIFPVLTFPVIPMLAKMLGYKPVFCPVDPCTFNAGPEHIEPKITDKTGAVLATHLFGQPCPIREVTELARGRDIRVLEDCAHACGVRVGGKRVGTFGDIGIFSFAEGKNMPCFGGGAIVTVDDGIARRARDTLARAALPSGGDAVKQAASIWVKWLLTRPLIFGLTVYPLLRLKLMLRQPLMDSAVGDDLLAEFAASTPRVRRLTNLQAKIGLLQLKHIDAFNEGARRNARILTEHLGEVPGVIAPGADQGDHIYVYYPLTVNPDSRDDLRLYLLTRGIDSKNTDMSECAGLGPFRDDGATREKERGPSEASILEICVYPVLSKDKMVRIARAIRAWAGLSPLSNKSTGRPFPIP